jgi:hypothetical protein
MTDQIEQRARAMWSSRSIQADIAKIAHKYGFSKGEIIWLDWDVLPETIRDHVRDIARKEVESES